MFGKDQCLRNEVLAIILPSDESCVGILVGILCMTGIVGRVISVEASPFFRGLRRLFLNRQYIIAESYRGL